MSSIIDDFYDLYSAISSNIADMSLHGLLQFMNLSFEVSPYPWICRPLHVLFGWDLEGYYRHLTYNGEGSAFDAVYVFGTKDGSVRECAIFRHGDMWLANTPPREPDVKVLFRDVQTFWAFILSGGEDVLEAILENTVDVHGNPNFLYKFGFMTRDLMQRVKLPVPISN